MRPLLLQSSSSAYHSAMKQEIPTYMRAVAIDRFGGPEVLKVQTVPVPDLGPGDILIRVEVAGVGEWDPFERGGGYAEMLGLQPTFPYILGSEGAGVVAAVGEHVDRFKEGRHERGGGGRGASHLRRI